MDRFRYHFIKFICYLLSFAMMVSIVCACVFSVMTVTIANNTFMVKRFSSDKVISILAENFDKSIGEFAQEVNVPKSVFVNVSGYDFIKNSQVTVVGGTNGEGDFDLSGISNLKEQYKTALTEYDRENNIRRTNAQRERICSGASEIFNETCSIKNNAQLSEVSAVINGRSVYFAIAGFAIFAMCAFAEYLLNNRMHKGFNYIAMAGIASGEILIVIPLIILMFNILGKLTLTNITAYNIAINSGVKYMLTGLIIIGIVLISAGVAIFISNYKYYKVKLIESDTEFVIDKNLIR